MRKDLTVKDSAPLAGNEAGNPLALAQSDFRRTAGYSDDADADKVPWGRYFKALWRYRFAVLAVNLLGAAAAYKVASSIPATYQASAGVWVLNVQTRDGGVSPVRSQQSMTSTSWIELARSPVILDSVVKTLSLHIRYPEARDTNLFRGLDTPDTVPTGRYVLDTDSLESYFVLRDAVGNTLDSGVVGDSIGNELGLKWAPEKIGRPGPITFDLITYREASDRLISALEFDLPEYGGQMHIRLTGTNPKLITETVNAVTNEFIEYATKFARQTQRDIRETLAAQKAVAEAEYNRALDSLERHRIATVTAPTSAVSVQEGVEATKGVATSSYLTRRQKLMAYNNDATRLDSVTKQVDLGDQSPNAFLGISYVMEVGTGLTEAIARFRAEEAKLLEVGNIYSDSNRAYTDQKAAMDRVRKQLVIPAANALRTQLENEIASLTFQLKAEAEEMKEIPPNQIRDMMLQADMLLRQSTFEMITARYAESEMSEASAIPDVHLGYPAIRPSTADSETAARIFAIIIIIALAISVALAILLDRLDKKFRYPDQATRDLGLTILGAIPRIRRINSWQSDPAVAASVIEAFRSVRLALANAFPNGEPITVAISSPGVGEGKSLVSSNLALSLAQGGYRTLLIDGDTRRGELHKDLGVERRPGLLDHLAGQASLAEIVQKTATDDLWMIAAGTRFKRGPELLMTPAAKPMLEELKSRFDAIIIDTPPLSAGVDAFVLGTAVSNMIVVLRVGKSDRKLAEAKLDLVDRLPIRVIGTVLNAVQGVQEYQYYSYVDGYAAEEDEGELPQISGAPSGGALVTKQR